MITQKLLSQRSIDFAMPKEKVYRFGISRIISLYLLPVFAASLVPYILVSKVFGITPVEVLAWSLFLIYASGVFVFLFFNHLRSEKHTKLIITGNTYQLIQGDLIYSWRYDQVEEIIEYSAGRLPWAFMMKWKICTGDHEFFISSLTISSSDFEYHFRDKIKRKSSLLPMM